jgi:hypothetical protein
MFHSTQVRIMLNKKNQSRLAFAPPKKKKKNQSQNEYHLLSLEVSSMHKTQDCVHLKAGQRSMQSNTTETLLSVA